MEPRVVNTPIGEQNARAQCRGTVCRPVSERSLVTIAAPAPRIAVALEDASIRLGQREPSGINASRAPKPRSGAVLALQSVRCTAHTGVTGSLSHALSAQP